MSVFVLAILKYVYLALLWVFVLTVITLIRRDIFSTQKSLMARMAHSSALKSARTLSAVRQPAQSGVALQNQGSTQPSNQPTAVNVISGIAEGDYFALNSFEATIGRANTATIVLDDSFVSSVHARIFKTNDRFYIEDCRSTNGTIVDGKAIKQTTPLHLGSKIVIGKNVLELV
ncbi:MAG: FHA domain-containing protein [Candidatus Ancillula sp.]|jgi:pSer/pThr/pTyr-binding forkhead associated (FHA) protein|nr:FHA domain-containing protein [Candidatus Ancillula sp.]